MGQSSGRKLLIRAADDGQGGRAQLSEMFMSALQAIEGDRLDILYLHRGEGATGIIERLSGRIDGITSDVEQALVSRLLADRPSCVFVDGSNLGRLVRLIKRALPQIPVITLFHNVEARFFFDAARASPSLHALGVLAANTLAERWAARYSDRRVMLNKRDARMLGLFYSRPGTNILPMALRDQHDPNADLTTPPYKKPYALFVGGAFYANVEGIAWYAREVAARAPMDTLVIGRGMETHRSRLEQWGGVRVVGAVDDLAPWYAHAQIVVAPILSGSGMKTKTAEAMMHGKLIAGTAEAFEGYEMLAQDGLSRCSTASDFLEALQGSVFNEAGFNHKLRERYLQYHSEVSMRKALKSILEKASTNEVL